MEKEQGDKLHNCDQPEDASGSKQLTLLLIKLWSAITHWMKEKRYMSSRIIFLLQKRKTIKLLQL
jgi:hypothetical protein